MAAATRAILERGGWVSSLDLIRAGVVNPRAAIAELQRRGLEIDERAGRGRFAEWRLRQQLPDERNPAIARESEQLDRRP